MIEVALELIKTPFESAFNQFVDEISSDCLICSPYVTARPIRDLVRTVRAKKLGNAVRINLLTDISYPALVHGATEVSALLYLYDHCPNACVTYLPKIHAKVYLASPKCAIVGSANFTRGGARNNFEYGVRISNSAVVRKIWRDMNQYKRLGAPIDRKQLSVICAQVERIKRTIAREQKIVARKIALHSRRQREEIEVNLIRARVNNRGVHAIFSETILYLLSAGPVKTSQLNQQISGIHPDLCDENLNREIDGVSYGKLWKHRVRNAQVTLRKQGVIFRDPATGLWHKTER